MPDKIRMPQSNSEPKTRKRRNTILPSAVIEPEPEQFASNRSKRREQRIKDEMKPEIGHGPFTHHLVSTSGRRHHETKSTNSFVYFVSFCAQSNSYDLARKPVIPDRNCDADGIE